MRAFANFSNALSDEERLDIIKRGNPQMTHEQASQYLHALEERHERKMELVERGYSNALAERFLDKQEWLRPFGWHSVCFYPGSNRLRNRYVVIVVIAVVFGVWELTHNG